MLKFMRNLDYVGRRRTWYAISLVVIGLGLLSLILPGQGLRLGIDFTGGLYLDLGFPTGTAPSVEEVDNILTERDHQGSVVQRTLAGDSVIVRTPPMDETGRELLLALLRDRLPDFTLLQMEVVQPVIGRELTQRGLLALLLAIIGMVIYITFRFEFKSAVCTMVALGHDVLVVLSVLSILRTEINSPFIAAVLTIIGYSVNDTIVVFDRIRENKRERESEPLPAMVNDSIRETLGRTINTSVTTLLAIGAILVFGGRTTRDFALALSLGVVAGSYSSIFIASPLWVGWKLGEKRARQPRPVLAPAAPAKTKPATAKKAAGPAPGKARSRPKPKATAK